MANTVASRKAKGRKLQQYVAKKISQLLDIPCGKDELIESRPMGQSGVDVRLTGKAKELFKYSIEAKNSEKWSIPEFIKQAKQNQMEGTNWLLIIKKNNYEPIVIMDAEHFFELVDKALRYEFRWFDGRC